MIESPISSDQLSQPAGRVARAAARSLLLRLLEESARLIIRSGEPAPSLRRHRPEAEEDPEAVHDFRVALRRLRSRLQAFRPILGDAISKRSEQRLRRLLRIAGPARDLQVGRELLLEIAGTRQSLVAVEARRVAGRFQREEFGARRRLVRAVVRDLSADAARLAEELQPVLAGAMDPSLAAAMASLLKRRLRKVRSTMGKLVRGSRMESYHAARIAVKRLRYLLEAFDGTSRLAATAVLRLTALQDALGRLNDELVLARRVTEERAKVVLRRRLQRRVAAARRRAYTLSRSRDVTIAWDATARLIYRLARHR
jgi:CHAD domain-containing protein